ncbi:hypothetical protein BGZ67_006730 [Mortierella alpina]|nr:hypothetical protein BGZ67_006730 [Mortierella alpina]
MASSTLGLSLFRGALVATPAAVTPASMALPNSDATRIVTKRGKMYPRSDVDSIVSQLIEQETNRMIRATTRQMSQEVAMERAMLRAQQASANTSTSIAAIQAPQPAPPTVSFVSSHAGTTTGTMASSTLGLYLFRGARVSTPAAVTSAHVAPPQSDATRIVTKCGKMYPRSDVDSIVGQLMEQETNRMIRAVAAQMSQEVAMERATLRGQQREEILQRESDTIMSDVMNEAMDSITADIMAKLFRESKLMRRVVDHWKEYTRTRIQHRRRQEYVLANLRAMASRAGLQDINPRAMKTRHYDAVAVANKRKLLLSMDPEVSFDQAYVAQLKK